MLIETTGTIVDGKIELDEPLDLPNLSPVRVTVQLRSGVTNDARLAWEATKQRLAEHPIHGGGQRFTRDELHERH